MTNPWREPDVGAPDGRLLVGVPYALDVDGARERIGGADGGLAVAVEVRLATDRRYCPGASVDSVDVSTGSVAPLMPAQPPAS